MDHMYVSYRGLGPGGFLDPARWNGMVAVTVGVGALLNGFRWLAVAGIIGSLIYANDGMAKKRA
jgi:hypothetical protein